MLNRIFVASGLIIAAGIASACLYYGVAGNSLTASVHPQKISFGEKGVYRIVVRVNADTDITTPEDKDVLTGFTKIRNGWSQRVFLWRKRRELWWSFTSEVTGDCEIPSVTVRLTDSSGATSSVSTEPVALTVKTLVDIKNDVIYSARVGGDLVGTGSSSAGSGGLRSVDGDIRIKIKDERSPIGIVDKDELMITFAACFIGVVIIYIVFLVLSRRPPKKIIVSPDKALMERLDKIDVMINDGSSETKDLYYEFSSSVREYLKSVLGVSSREPTTKELIDIIERTGSVEPSAKSIYAQTLISCDAAKYSQAHGADMGLLSATIANIRSAVAPSPSSDKSKKR